MRTEVRFSSKRFLLALMLCACSVILLLDDDLDRQTSFTFNLICLAVGLGICFLLFLPSILLKIRTDSDVPTLVRCCTPRLHLPVAIFYAMYFVYTAVFFLLPYTDMFHIKYFPDVTPCLITTLMLLGCAYAASKGVNVISRFGIFLFLFALLTNFLMFGGSIAELDFRHYHFTPEGSAGGFLQNTLYFVTPAFIAAVYACCSGTTRNFRFRQPLLALVFTGAKYAAVLFFIWFALGDYAMRQEYRTFVLSRVAHFGVFAGIESFYLALATMSVFMIVSLFLCCMTRCAGSGGSWKSILLFTAIILALYVTATYLPAVKEVLMQPALMLFFTFVAAAVVPFVYLFVGRKSNAKKA
ncbi:MAG: GerAB/ArcD/ProY family transporter [Ruminococcus sp.]|nr:GerAB/ArcD/ProY family transporter [Ruminococcus sp.]